MTETVFADALVPHIFVQGGQLAQSGLQRPYRREASGRTRVGLTTA